MRIKGLLTEEIPKRFILGMTGYNSHDRFCSVWELNDKGYMERRAKSYDMVIAFFHEGVAWMPKTDSTFNWNASVSTNKHIDAIWWECRKQKIDVRKFIPAFGGDYESGFSTIERHHYLVVPTKPNYHLSKKTWKTERGALENAIRWIDSYQRFPNFANMDVECVDNSWHIRLDYKPLFLPSLEDAEL